MLLLAALACDVAGAQNAQISLTEQQQAWVRAHPKIRVGVYNNEWPPFETVRNGRPEGLAPETLQAAADSLGLTLEPKVYRNWNEVLEAACSGEIDVVMDLVLTSERTHCMVFTRAYASAPLGIASRRKDGRAEATPDLAGLRIAIERDHVTGMRVRERYPDSLYVETGSSSEALALVSSGDADFYVGNAYVIQRFASEPEFANLELLQPADLGPTSLHFGVPNAKQPLVEALDAALAVLPDASLSALRVKWLDPLEWSKAAGLRFSIQEREALARPVRLGVMKSWMPIAFIDGHGEPSGIAGEYLERFVQAGARNLKVVAFDRWQDMRQALSDGRLDAAIAVSDSAQDLRYGRHVSEPFLTVSNVVVTSIASPRVIDLRDLNGRRVALSDPDRIGPLLLAQAPQAKIVRAADTSGALRMVNDARADASIGNLAVIDRILRDTYAGRLQIAAPAGIDDRLVLSAGRDQASLVTAFDQMLTAMPAREHEAIRGDWLAIDFRPAIDWRQVLLWGAPVALVLLTAGIVHAGGHVRLRREVVQRRLAEDRLARVTRRLPAVVYQLHRSSDGTYSFPFIAGDFYSLFGVDLEDALNDERLAFERIHPDDRERINAEAGHAATTGGGLSFQFRTLSPGGWRWVYSKGEPMESQEAGVDWIGYWVDVTDAHEQSEALSAAKAEAERAGQVKADFLATMSHEIRTPMAGIVGMLEVLSHTRLNEEQTAILATMERSAAMLRQLLDDTLDFSKIEANALTLALRSVDLRELASATIEMFAGGAASKGLLLSTEIGPHLASRHLADEIRVKQILFNLVGNAIKFTAQGIVKVAITVDASEAAAQRIRICVSDTGIGISQEQMQRIFDPFTQAEPSITRQYGGTGLGLSISRRLASLMGGELTLDSEQGKGTSATFSLSLPLSDVGGEEECAVEPLHRSAVVSIDPPGDGGRWKVLVAEDHETNRELMRWRMQQLHLDFLIVEDGAQAMSALQNDCFDLIVTDCQMPVLDGYTLARRVREGEGDGERMAIVAITASTLTNEADRAAKAGIDELLAKPVSLDALRASIERWLPRKKRAERKLQATTGQALRDRNSEQVADFGLLSVEQLQEVFGPSGLALSMLTSFRRLCLDDIDALERAVEGLDTESCEQLLHRIGGGLGSIMAESGALELRIIHAAILRDGVASHLVSLNELLQRLKAAIGALPA
ncbi:transporter substrate-binding domain-containing protein [Stenotrophomonas sp. Sa5BUN4]|uniref:histidine kinase n=1 Tax=Stenotrophomonas lacuserhaii TaxID=2760084 RepID=A0A8X8FQX0_9GAMM|nr:transporter substrate-binding domain-containing protein [Stenotrophomonas pennii]MBD7954316.1 transporter substrate-binding domain-containing protein [Stenotrophomonas pennii]